MLLGQQAAKDRLAGLVALLHRHRLGPTALGHDPVEQAPCGRGDEQGQGVVGAGGLAGQGDVAGVTTECRDVVPDPFEPLDDVERAVVARAVEGVAVAQGRVTEPAHLPHPVRDGHEDHLRSAGDRPAGRVGKPRHLELIRPTGHPDVHRQAHLGVVGPPDVEVEAVLGAVRGARHPGCGTELGALAHARPGFRVTRGPPAQVADRRCPKRDPPPGHGVLEVVGTPNRPGPGLHLERPAQ